MTFLSTASEKMYLIMQKNHKNYERNILILRYNMTKSQIDAIENYYRDLNAGGTTYNVEDDDEYQALQRTSDLLQTEQESLDASIQALDAQITSEANLIKEGIKGSCGLTLSGG